MNVNTFYKLISFYDEEHKAIYKSFEKSLNTLKLLFFTMTKTLTIPISDELHSKFKTYCVNKEVNMKDAVIVAIERVLKHIK